MVFYYRKLLGSYPNECGLQNKCINLKLICKQVRKLTLVYGGLLVSSLLGACLANGWRNFKGASSWARCHFVCSVYAAGATISPVPTWSRTFCLFNFFAGVLVTILVFVWWLLQLVDSCLSCCATTLTCSSIRGLNTIIFFGKSYFFNWHQEDNLHVWLFLDSVDRGNVAICCLASYICHYDDPSFRHVRFGCFRR